MASESTPQRRSEGSFINFAATVLTFTLAFVALYTGRHEIGNMLAPVLGYTVNNASAALTITATPTDAERLKLLYPDKPQAPVAPQPAPVIIRVENTDPAPNIAPQPAQPVTAPASNSAEVQATSAPVNVPVVIVQRVTDSGGQTITGAGACRVNNRVAKRCGK